jgi:hypothetical protein
MLTLSNIASDYYTSVDAYSVCICCSCNLFYSTAMLAETTCSLFKTGAGSSGRVSSSSARPKLTAVLALLYAAPLLSICVPTFFAACSSPMMAVRHLPDITTAAEGHLSTERAVHVGAVPAGAVSLLGCSRLLTLCRCTTSSTQLALNYNSLRLPLFYSYQYALGNISWCMPTTSSTPNHYCWLPMPHAASRQTSAR